MEYEIKPAGKFSFNLKEVWDYNELFYFFTWRDIKVKYKQTVLGFAWAILQPTLMMLVFTFLFGRAIGAQNEMSLPYPVFVYSGLMMWGIFSGGLQAAGNSMVNNANIIKKIYFPRLIIPISSILVSVFDFIMTVLPFIALLLYYKTPVDWTRLITLGPLSFFIILLTTFGTGSFLAALNVKYRDFRYILPFMVQFLMFATPVIYPISSIENEKLKFLVSLNPISISLDLYRSIFEPLPINWTVTTIGISLSVVSLFVGIYYFRKTEAYFADLA